MARAVLSTRLIVATCHLFQSCCTFHSRATTWMAIAFLRCNLWVTSGKLTIFPLPILEILPWASGESDSGPLVDVERQIHYVIICKLIVHSSVSPKRWLWAALKQYIAAVEDISNSDWPEDPDKVISFSKSMDRIFCFQICATDLVT